MLKRDFNKNLSRVLFLCLVWHFHRMMPLLILLFSGTKTSNVGEHFELLKQRPDFRPLYYARRHIFKVQIKWISIRETLNLSTNAYSSTNIHIYGVGGTNKRR